MDCGVSCVRIDIFKMAISLPIWSLASGYRFAMRNNATIILTVCFTALGLGLFLSDLLLALRNSRDTQLIQKYECGYLPQNPCKADFDGDGRLTHIEVNLRYDRVELPPHFVGNEDEVVLNAFSQDNSSRTHVAVRNESDHARLMIYDGTRWPGEKIAVNAVYAWNGSKLVETAPADTDKEILLAMAARDDAGTFPQWILYYLVAWPSRLVYVSLFVVAAILYRKYRRVEGMTPLRA